LTEGRGFAQQAPTSPPQANIRTLGATLDGPAIDGLTPSGKATFTAFQGGTSLTVGAGGINLPDGSVLTVELDGKVVGSMVVNFGNAGLLPIGSNTPTEVRPGAQITLSLAQIGGGIVPLAPALGSVIMSGTFQTL